MAKLMQSLEARRLLALATWDGGGDNATWTDALNWSGDLVPAQGDDVVINTSGPRIKLPPSLQLNNFSVSQREIYCPLFSGSHPLTIGDELRIGAGGHLNVETASSCNFLGTGVVEIEPDGQLTTVAEPPSGASTAKIISKISIRNRGTIFINGASECTGGITNFGTLTLHGSGKIYGSITNEVGGVINCYQRIFSPSTSNGPNIQVGLTKSDTGDVLAVPFINHGIVQIDYGATWSDLGREFAGSNNPVGGLTIFVDATPTLSGTWSAWQTSLKFAMYNTNSGNAHVSTDASFSFTRGSLKVENVDATLSGLSASTGLELYGNTNFTMAATRTDLALLRVAGLATARLGEAGRTLRVQDIELFGDGKIDIGDGLLIHGNRPGFMRSWVTNTTPAATPAYAGSLAGNVNGTPITIEPNGSRYGVGYTTGAGLASRYPSHTFQGQSFDDNDFVFFTTLRGDTNFDRQVNFDDAFLVAKRYSMPTTRGYVDGNFSGNVTGNGTVNFDDLLIIAQNYGTPFAQSSTRIGLVAKRATRGDEITI